jgi:predicted pyridoxine 5'-phosphate oxidase superfamily flavin-nucleotide-binding protein
LLSGCVDAAGHPWASVLAGGPGFVHSPDPRMLDVDATPDAHDPLAPALLAGAAIALLGIQPHTRRRNRLNGHVTGVRPGGFRIRVDQSFGNCPKYIQAREPQFTGEASAAPAETMDALDAQAIALVRRADTLFIASAHPHARDAAAPEQGVDVSHRGGRPGFVQADDAGRVLVLPDFVGNSYFNTYGNLLLEPRCGLLFFDPDSGDTLQLAARAQIVAEGETLASFRGARRLLRLEVARVLRRRRALPLRWGPVEYSPALEATGTW